MLQTTEERIDELRRKALPPREQGYDAEPLYGVM
jgi:hypothetical protein